jgi:hypothetical protein
VAINGYWMLLLVHYEIYVLELYRVYCFSNHLEDIPGPRLMSLCTNFLKK